MEKILGIAVAGAVGCLARYGMGVALPRVGFLQFPMGTFAANIVGCFLIGLVAEIATRGLHPLLTVTLTVGFLGGFTTFSAYSLETIQLLQANQFLVAALYGAGSVFFGLFATWIGMFVMRLFF